MRGPYLSVIVPVYKTEEYLKRCIYSILKQTFADFELLLIDDCSPDNSGAICDRYAAEDDRIRVIHNPSNVGLSEVRNIGIRESCGSFITFVDSDDCIVPQAFEVLVNLQKTVNADITVGGITEFRDQQKIKPVTGVFPIHSYTQQAYAEIYFKINGNRTVYYMHSKLFRRAIAEKMVFPVGLTSEDVAGLFCAICASSVIVETEQPLYWYFFNTAGITHSGFTERDFHLIPVWDQVVAYSREYAPEYLEYAQLNRDRIAMTLLFRMNKNRTKAFPQQEKALRTEIRQNGSKLLHSSMPKTRKLILLGYQTVYPLTRFLLGVAGSIGIV